MLFFQITKGLFVDLPRAIITRIGNVISYFARLTYYITRDIPFSKPLLWLWDTSLSSARYIGNKITTGVPYLSVQCVKKLALVFPAMKHVISETFGLIYNTVATAFSLVGQFFLGLPSMVYYISSTGFSLVELVFSSIKWLTFECMPFLDWIVRDIFGRIYDFVKEVQGFVTWIIKVADLAARKADMCQKCGTD